MAVMRWRPFSPALEQWVGGDIQTEVNHLYDACFDRAAPASAPERAWAPTADMFEDKDDLVIKADLPGMSEKDVQVSIAGELLSLKGQRLELEDRRPEQYFRAERWTGRVERIFKLPIPV